jgi:PAS domain S-box-containing protein
LTSGGGCHSAVEIVDGLDPSGLPDGTHDLDRLGRLTARLLQAPVALISLVQGERLLVMGAHGLPEPWASSRELPVAQAICQHVIAARAALIVNDARAHPLLHDNPVVRELNVVAYLGVPLLGPDGEVLGSVCVTDTTARVWSEAEIEALTGLSEAIRGRITAQLYLRERSRAEAAQRAAEARAAEILESIDDGFYAIDRDWRFLYVNRQAERLWGVRREEILGRSLFEVYPHFAGSGARAAHEQAMAEARPVRIETVSVIFGAPIEINIFPNPSGLSVYFRDISERKRMEQDLRERDEILTLAERSAEIGVWDVDLATGMVRATPQFFRILGLEPADGLVPLEALRAVRHPEDRERVVQGFKDALASGADSYEMEYRIIRPDGQVRWIFGRGRVVRDAGGRAKRYSGVDIDITERKRLEEHQKLLVGELSHRVKNTIAVIQSIAKQSLTDGRPLAEAREAFLRRLQALAHTHGLLTESNWQGARLSALIKDELKPYGGHAIVRGEDLVLTPRAAVTLGLVLHELAANAAKHGALGVPEGRVEVTWAIEPGGHFRLRWREQGGPAVLPPARRGFGTTILERAAAYELDAQASLSFAPGGLQYELTVPLDQVSAGAMPP